MNAEIAIRKVTSFVSGSTLRMGNILAPAWRVLMLSPADEGISAKKCLCVSVEREGLSIAYGSRVMSRISVNQVRRYPMELWVYPEAEDVASTVSLTVADLKARRAEITLCIPKAWAVIATTELPATVKENLSDVISYELDRITPFSSEEAFFDFKVVSEDADKVKVLVAAAKRNVVAPYLEALKEKGLKVSGLTVSLSSLGALCNYSLKREDLVYMDVGRNSYEGGALAGGSLVASCMGTFASEDDSARVDIIAREVGNLLASANSDDAAADVVLALHDDVRQLGGMLKDHVSAPVRILGEETLALKLPGQEKGTSFVAIGGVVEALWPKTRPLNLLNMGHHEKPRTPKILTIILLLGIVALLVLYSVAPVRIEDKRLEEINRQISARKEEVKKVEALKKDIETLSAEVKTIDTFKDSKPMALMMLRELTTILPKSAWLTRVRLAETTVEIEGYAATATELLPKIETSKYFSKVEFASPTFRDARLNSERFIIKAEIEGAKKPEPEKGKGEAQKVEKK
ncbi:MAG: PilN domain-containing protein [Chloroflexota bacterium]